MNSFISISIGFSIIVILITSSDCRRFVPKRQAILDAQPGVDYPAYSQVPPRLQFSCKDRVGYYADPETNCQVWHWCVPGGQKFSFLCPNGTVFNQQYRVCDWWYNVDCSVAPNLYNINDDLYRDADGNLI